MDAYFRIFNDYNAKPDFLEKLTAEENPIIFLVPHKLFANRQGETAKEMQWLLNNPAGMKNVHFVFGAYKVYSKKIITKIDLEKRQVDQYTQYLTTRIFQQLQAGLCLPRMEDIFRKDLDDVDVLIEKFERFSLKRFEKPIKILQPMIFDLDDDEIVVKPLSLPESATDLKILKSRRAIFLIGGCGAGKGTLRDLLIDRHRERNYIVIDPDDIKESMPEYQKGLKLGNANAATEVHQESVRQATEKLKLTVQSKENFIYDSSGSRVWIYEEQMAVAKEQGMFVELIYVVTKVESCILRTQERAKGNGRVVPEETVRSSNECAELCFESLKKFSHRWKKYNNDGTKPLLVDSSKIARKSLSNSK